ncbi:MAG TPA: ABC-type transport auxiliary lipoprotein family protein [Sphingomicrobium sp.]|nr:ABC-type transport auxiliary lipoprotein family protein [Sphingomicrobium sp.]
MKLSPRIAPAALALALGACASILGGGGKPPPYLFTLTPEASDPGTIVRTAGAGQAVTIADPVIAKELQTVRVPVQVSPTVVQYVPNLQWVDTPDHLFKNLVAETVRRTTNRVVLDPGATTLDPGVVIAGQLQRFGYDAQSGHVVVQYDGAMSTGGGHQVQTRRFTATAPADGTAGTVGPALNRAANQVALEVAQWVGG